MGKIVQIYFLVFYGSCWVFKSFRRDIENFNNREEDLQDMNGCLRIHRGHF